MNTNYSISYSNHPYTREWRTNETGHTSLTVTTYETHNSYNVIQTDKQRLGVTSKRTGAFIEKTGQLFEAQIQRCKYHYHNNYLLRLLLQGKVKPMIISGRHFMSNEYFVSIIMTFRSQNVLIRTWYPYYPFNLIRLLLSRSAPRLDLKASLHESSK